MRTEEPSSECLLYIYQQTTSDVHPPRIKLACLKFSKIFTDRMRLQQNCNLYCMAIGFFTDPRRSDFWFSTADPYLYKDKLIPVSDTTTQSLVQRYKNICLLRLKKINVSYLPNWSTMPYWQISRKVLFRSLKKVKIFHHQDRELAIICKKV